MDQFLQMNIFFFVTTVSVVVITALALLAFVRIWKILSHIERITDVFAAESELLRGDIAQLRSAVRVESAKVGTIVHLALNSLHTFFRRRRK